MFPVPDLFVFLLMQHVANKQGVFLSWKAMPFFKNMEKLKKLLNTKNVEI